MIKNLNYIYMQNFSKLVLPLISTSIISFPILISVIYDIVNNLNLKYPNIILNFIKNILNMIQTEPEEQLNTLIFNNLLNLIQGLLFFVTISLFNKDVKSIIEKKKFNLSLKLKIIITNIIIIIGIFFKNKKLLKFIV